jgi:quercetin 2,3-dioxygenase
MIDSTKINIRRADERGHADHGWLNSWFSFSFAEYYDPAHMGFHSLRVINDDVIAGGGGFPTHPHRDMEIFSYLLAGNLAHKDSMGNSRVLQPGEIQLMRAGTGVYHSEFNPSPSEPAHLLQIWITPNTKNLPPAYTEWTPQAGRENDPKTLVISADGRDGSATIAQDASIYLLKLQPGDQTDHFLNTGRGLWLQIAKGAVSVNGISLRSGDAISLEEAGKIEITATETTEAILFDLA